MEKIRILFLAANPTGTTPLKLDEEAREIESKIGRSAHRESLELITRWAVRPDDLIQYLNQYQPHVVHFSGHGSDTQEIILLDDAGNPKPVDKKALVSLFRTLKDNVRVVLLNACYSRPQAEAIVEQIDCTIGMGRDIGDAAAITFAASFYRAIGFGRSVRQAFDQGVTALLLEGIPEEGTPRLLTKESTPPETIVLIKPQPADLAKSGAADVETEKPANGSKESQHDGGRTRSAVATTGLRGAIPTNVMRFEVLAYASLGIGIVVSALEYQRLSTLMSAAEIGIIQFLVLAFLASQVWLASRRRKNWARWVFLIFFLAGIPFHIPLLSDVMSSAPVAGVLNALQVFVQGAALYFVFTGEANDWFRKKVSAQA